jgi:hypothetical protein
VKGILTRIEDGKKSAANRTAKGAPVSSISRKRARQSDHDPPRKQRKVSRTASGPEDDDETFKHEQPHKKMKKPETLDTDSSADTTDDRDSDSEESAASETSDINELAWEEVQELSVMVDINLVDKDYTSDMVDAKITSPRYEQTIGIANIGIFFRVLLVGGMSAYRNADRFPIAVVKHMIKKFNKDHLIRKSWRAEYQKIIKKKSLPSAVPVFASFWQTR